MALITMNKHKRELIHACENILYTPDHVTMLIKP